MPSVANASGGIVPGRGNKCSAPSSIKRPAAASAKVEAVATTRRDAESDDSSGTTTSHTAANDAMPPVSAASAVTNPVKANDDKTWALS